MPKSRWCVQDTLVLQQSTDEGWVEVNAHNWCQSMRWHDEFHGKNPGCCAGDIERESWACDCECHPKDNSDFHGA